MGDVLTLVALSLSAMFNPTLMAAVTVMVLLPHPRRLMFGFLLGALLTSVGCGVAVVFALHGTGSVETAQRTVSPGENFVIGALLVAVGLVLRSAWTAERRQRRQGRKAAQPKRESLPQRLLGRGSARIAFVAGALLSFPGASYLVALDRTARLDLPALGSVLVVVGFCLVQQLLLEVPLVGFALNPERTGRGVEAFRGWLERSGLRAAAGVALVLGALLLLRGAIEVVAS